MTDLQAIALAIMLQTILIVWSIFSSQRLFYLLEKEVHAIGATLREMAETLKLNSDLIRKLLEKYQN